MALVKVLNTSTVPRGIEIRNSRQEPDTQSILAHKSIVVDEEDILTSQSELTKRGLKLIQLSSGKTALKINTTTATDLSSTVASTETN